MSSDAASQIVYLARVLKAPSLRDSAERLAAAARDGGWTHQEYLAACLEAEAATRSAHGAANRIRAAGFPARKAIEDFDFDHQRSVKRDHVLHLATLDFITAKTNIVLLGPPGTGKTMLATGLGIKACQAGHRVLFGHRLRLDRPADGRPPRRPPAGRDHPAREAPAPGHRRDRLHPVRARGRQPVLPAHLRPLRNSQRHRHQQQALQQSAYVRVNLCQAAPKLHGFGSDGPTGPAGGFLLFCFALPQLMVAGILPGSMRSAR